MYNNAINCNTIQWMRVVLLCRLHSESAPSSSPDFCPIPHPGLISNASPGLPASPPYKQTGTQQNKLFSLFLLHDSIWTDID